MNLKSPLTKSISKSRPGVCSWRNVCCL